MFKLKLCLFIFIIGGFCQKAIGQQKVVFDGALIALGDNLEILTDTNSSISLNEAIHSKRFVKSEDEYPNLGITPFSYWIRVTIINNTSSSNLGIQITQPMIDSIGFYQLSGGGKLVKSNYSGQGRLFNSRLIQHQNYIYPVSVTSGQASTFYFHIKSYKQLVLPIYLEKFEDVIVSAFITDLLFGIYVGIIMVMLLYNLFIYVTVKDINYLYYVLYLFIVLLTQACLEGYIFRFILPGSPVAANLGIYITSALIGIAAIEFSKKFLSAKNYTPTLYKISYAFWLVYAIEITLALKGQFNASYTVVLMAAMLSAIYVIVMAVIIASKGFRPAKFFLIAWSVFIFCVVIYVLKDFNIIPYNKFTSSSLLIGSAIEAVMLSFALADKINVFKAEKEKSQEEALNALKENDRIISEQNAILETKVSERTIELNETNQELNKTLYNLKQAQGQLVEAEKMASLGQLTAGIAHEINNPINFVTGNIKPLSRDIDIVIDAIAAIEKVGLSDLTTAEKQKQISSYKEGVDFDYLTIEIQHLLKGIKEGANRTAEIVRGLRVFSRLDQDNLVKTDINEGLDSTLIIANNLLNRIDVVKEYGSLPKLECYAGKLNQVFLNLISNASYAVHQKFGEGAGGKITIKTFSDEGNVFILIADNGTGMDEETQKKIFDPFFTTKDVGEGTGLGMSISYNVIIKHKGQIQVTSTLGEGAQFIIKLPLFYK